MKKSAFTLAEVFIAMAVLGFLAVLAVANIKSKMFNDKGLALQIYKTIENINSSASSIKEFDKDKCPTSQFMTRMSERTMNDEGNIEINDTYQYALYNGENLATDPKSVRDIFGEYLKTQAYIDDVCSNTAYTGDLCGQKDAIPGMKIVGDVYVGFANIAQSANDVYNCPTYILPVLDTKNSEVTTNTYTPYDTYSNTEKKCWGELFIDLNGKKSPNELGKDVFILGLDSDGVAK